MSADELVSQMDKFLKQARQHEVKPGQTVWNILRGTGITMPEMQLANLDIDLGNIHPGDKLNIPEGAELERIRTMLQKPSLKGEFDLKSSVRDAAGRYGISPKLLEALVFVESSNNPKADSGEAQGLTQLTPYAQRFVGVRNPFDPMQSLYGGAHWLSIALQEAGALKGADPRQKLQHALMIYHAGRPAVQAWINRGSPAGGYKSVKGKTLSYPQKILRLIGQ